MNPLAWLFATVLVAGCSPPPPPNTALPRAFSKVAATLETGIAYRDYSPLIAEANLELRSYAESDQGRNHPQAVEQYRQALARYIEARDLWASKFETGSYSLPGIICIGGILDHQYAVRYPAAPTSDLQCQNRGFRVEDLLPHLWRDAGDIAAGAALKMKP